MIILWQEEADNIEDGMSLWKGDLIEIFFGAVEPVSWPFPLAVGAGGGRLDSRGRYSGLGGRLKCSDTNSA